VQTSLLSIEGQGLRSGTSVFSQNLGVLTFCSISVFRETIPSIKQVFLMGSILWKTFQLVIFYAMMNSMLVATLEVLLLKRLVIMTKSRKLMPQLFSYTLAFKIDFFYRPNELSFESSAREGAILTMPYGAVAQDLASIIHFEDYMAQHSENWYKFIIGVRGRKIGNGSVRLVIGADMAPAWGMATFAQSSAQSSLLQLRFKPTVVSAGEHTYSWEYSGVADAKSGPSSAEMERLRSDDNADAGSRYINQSLFVRTLTATFEKAIWDELMSNIKSARINAGNSRNLTNIYSPLGTSSGTPSATSNENSTTWTRGNSDNLSGLSLVMSSTAQLEPSLYIVSDITNTVSICTSEVDAYCLPSLHLQIVHPSNRINDLLLKMVNICISVICRLINSESRSRTCFLMRHQE
jgi:hypothetical protein